MSLTWNLLTNSHAFQNSDFNLREIRDRLFTACKTGNMDAFDSILNELGDLYSSRLNSNGSEYSSNPQTNGVASDANSSAEINSSPDPPASNFGIKWISVAIS